MNQSIVIIGFMGSGKTTVARALAEKLKGSVADVDDVIAIREGRTAKQIFETKGEGEFRKIETIVLSEVLTGQNQRVIAAGGGAWTVETNRQLIRDCGAVTVWLDAPFELCWARIAAGGQTRPLARTKEMAQALFAERLAVYESADLRIPVTAGRSSEEIADEIVKAISGDPPRP